jgi:hypothetical protein
MSPSTHEPNDLLQRIQTLVGAGSADVVTDDRVHELEELLRGNEEAQDIYLELVGLSVFLPRALAGAVRVRKGDQLLDEVHPVDVVPPDQFRRHAAFTVTPPVAFPRMFGHLSGWPVAYLIATVIFAVGLAIGALVHVSRPGSYTGPAVSPGVNRQSPIPDSSPIVARVTGMVDCVLDNDECRMMNDELRTKKTDIQHSAFSIQHSLLYLGDRLALRSGLLELTYNTGAKVILQGPVHYAMESPSGGYLSVGKLTAKLEQRSEVSGQRSGSANQKSEIGNQTFAVRTPTALVTDLGTEFGVEVGPQGVTTTRVFKGLVRVQTVGPEGKTQDEGRVLHHDESVRVDPNGNQRSIVVLSSATGSEFIRQLPLPSTVSLDLVDVVAGGDGWSNRRNRGIDPTTGRTSDPLQRPSTLTGDHQYHRVKSLPFVDGVFIPDGGEGPVQVDSDGHTFRFDKSSNLTCGYIWAGGHVGYAAPEGFRTELDGVDYASPNHGILALIANKAITFDLRAIRRANPGRKLVRFHAVAGNTEPDSRKGDFVYADVAVLVDGRPRYQRKHFNFYTGALLIEFDLGNRDSFLTLAATDGGNGERCDWVMFGDPRLEFVEHADKSTIP